MATKITTTADNATRITVTGTTGDSMSAKLTETQTLALIWDLARTLPIDHIARTSLGL